MISLLTSLSFSTSTAGLDWVSNQERTRWFLVLRLTTKSLGGLNKLLEASNRTVATFGLPLLYSQKLSSSQTHKNRSFSSKKAKRKRGSTASPVDKSLSTTSPPDLDDSSSGFHISIGWALDRPAAKQQDNQLDSELRQAGNIIAINVTSVKVKIGNSISTIPLSANRAMSNGIMGQ